MTFEFATASIPAYSLTPSASTNFFHDASGQPVTLAGTAGLKLVVHHASGTDLTGAACFHVSEESGPPRIVIDVQAV
ncbi:MAG: hypothetical protein E6I55_10175 [Chloroflexi bacterium]|nr:MAG: hypothetical protein E6I55_10175 [Chloroflexota bacterium]